MSEGKHLLTDETGDADGTRLPGRMAHSVWNFFKLLGPGLVTGAADDDPGGIGTYSSVGAAYGTNLLWMAMWQLPMMTDIQEVCARIGIVKRQGLSEALQLRYRKSVVGTAVLILIVANIANIGADIQAMVAAVRLLVPVKFIYAAIIIAFVILILEILVPYKIYSKYLKYLTVTLFAYVIAGFLVKPDWATVIKDTFVPSITWNREYIFAMIAVFGTTISPYLFFWQTSQEVEDLSGQEKEAGPSEHMPPRKRIHVMRKDVWTGMLLSQVVMFFIIVTTSQTLNKHGITNVQSAQQAANALKPVAGHYAFILFVVGIITTGLLAIPVLAGAGAYALCEVFKWREGLGKRFTRAKAYYGIITLSIILGLVLIFSGINPIKALYYSAFLNGIVAVPLMFLILRLGDDKRVMGLRTNPTWVRLFGWAAVAAASAAIVITAILYIAPLLKK